MESLQYSLVILYLGSFWYPAPMFQMVFGHVYDRTCTSTGYLH